MCFKTFGGGPWSCGGPRKGGGCGLADKQAAFQGRLCSLGHREWAVYAAHALIALNILVQLIPKINYRS